MTSVPVPHIRGLIATAAAAAVMASSSLAGQAAPAPTYRYADVADLTLRAPLVIVATVRDVARIKGAEATGVAPGRVRLYLTVDVVALIRGPGAVPPRLGYLYDAPLDPRGQVPRLKKQRVLLFARPVASAADQVQLVADDAQLTGDAATEAMVRRIATDAAAADAPPAITAIANAFHAAGSLPGEGETQIFLRTAGHPISLSVVRRQDRPPAWTVSLDEVVDNAQPPPPRDTFLWYRLACGLPRAVPTGILTGLDPADSTAIRDDYRVVQEGLGACR